MSIKGRLRKLEAKNFSGDPEVYMRHVRLLAELDDEGLSETEVIAEAKRLQSEGIPILTHEQWIDVLS